MSTNRCHKILLIWQENDKARYFRLLLDVATESHEWPTLRLTHNKFLLGTDYINGQTERAIMDVSVKLGLDGWSDSVTDFLGKWAQFEIAADKVVDLMGWDRVIITGVKTL